MLPSHDTNAQDAAGQTALAADDALPDQESEEEISEPPRAEEALRAAYERTVEILESISDAFYAVDHQWRFTYINRKAEEIWGIPRDELIGKVLWTEFDESVGTPLHARMLRAAAERRPAELEMFSQKLRRWIAVNIYPGPAGLSVYFRDITERKEAEEVLKESEARFRLLAENSTDKIARLSPDGRYQYVSPAVFHLLGYAPEELIGQNAYALIHPEDIPEVREAQDALLARPEAFTITYRIRHKEGHWIWFESTSRAVRDEQTGEVREIQASSRDITERRRAERVAQGQRAALTRTLNALRDNPDLDTFLGQVLATVAEELASHYTALWFFDPQEDRISPRLLCENGRVLTAEQAGHPAVLGRLSSGAAALWQEMMRTRAPLIIEDVLQDPRITSREWLLDRAAQTLLMVPLLLGSDLIGALNVFRPEPRPYHSEEIELAQALAQQATLAVQLSRQAQQAQQSAVVFERNRMAREIHDTLAQGFTGILVQLDGAEEMLTEDPPAAQAHIARARDLARQSLAEARRSVLALRPQALLHDRLPAALSALASQMLSGTGVHPEFHIHGTPVTLPSEIESNLLRIGLEALTNALRHARATAIRIALTYAPDQVTLSVQDNGAGIDPAALAAHRGFGLQSIQERAQAMGGRHRITGRPGRGTEVFVTVPVPVPLP